MWIRAVAIIGARMKGRICKQNCCLTAKYLLVLFVRIFAFGVGAPYAALKILKLGMLLPQPPKHQDHRYALRCLALPLTVLSTQFLHWYESLSRATLL